MNSPAHILIVSVCCVYFMTLPLQKICLFVFRFCINSEVKKVKLIYMGKLIKEGPTNGLT